VLLAAENETLYQHIDTGLLFLRKQYIETGYIDFIARKTGIGKAEELAKAIITLHDVAKGYDEYQERVRAGKKFPKHEFFSAYIADKTLNLDTEQKTMAELAIIWHHIAMRSPRFWVELRNWRKYNAPEVLNLRDPNRLLSILREVCLKWKISVISVENIPQKIGIYEIEDYIKKLYKLSETNTINLYLKTIYYVRILILCDNYAASINRATATREKIPIFLRDMSPPENIFKVRKQIEKLTKSIRRA